MNCKSCKHWVSKEEAPTTGYCHRNPPTFMGSMMGHSKLGQPIRQDNWGFPFSNGEDFCGQWENKVTLELA